MHKYDPRDERATRDIVSRGDVRGDARRPRTPNGGALHQRWAISVRTTCARLFKGMVERCDDCGFDLAGGLVEVVPTAHYMMGGVVFNADCTTELPGLFVAGEDSGGVHGANRLGGNGVANSTVFGGIAGDVDAGVGRGERRVSRARRATRSKRRSRAAASPLGKRPGDLAGLREKLYDLMWDDVGIVRDAASLDARGTARSTSSRAELDETGIAEANLAFNLTWHDWLNLKSLFLVSQVDPFRGAMAREDSRGAHYRATFRIVGRSPSLRLSRCV